MKRFAAIVREMPNPRLASSPLCAAKLRLGKPPEEAIEGVYQRTQVAEYGFFAVTLGVQTKSGGGLAETLQTLGDTVRQRVGLAARAKALAARGYLFRPQRFPCRHLLSGDCYTTSIRDRLTFCSPIRREEDCWPMPWLGDYRNPGDTLDGQEGRRRYDVSVSFLAVLAISGRSC